MFAVYNADTADDLWQSIAADFRSDHGVAQQVSRSGLVREIMHVGLAIREPRQRWIVSRRPPINPAFAVAEIIWIVSGRNDSRFLNFFNRSLPKYAGDCACYHGAYGYRLRHQLGFDQLERAFLALQNRPASRQVLLQIWDGRIDFPGQSGEEASPDIPCNVVSLLKLRGGCLEWMQVLRSNDFFRGQPYNIVQFTSLQEIIAGWLGVEPGHYHQVTDSLHVYDDCWKWLEQSPPTRCEVSNSVLALPRGESSCVFRELSQWVDRIIAFDSSASELASAARKSLLPPAYRDMLFVVLCEGLRRHNYRELAIEIGQECGDPVYRQLLQQWFHRVRVGNRGRIG